MRDRILALIPLKDGHVIPSNCIRSYIIQTVKIDLICVSRPSERSFFDIDDIECSHNTEHAITTNYNLLREEALKTDEDMFLLLHRDVCFKNTDDVSSLINFLETNPEYGAVAHNTRDTKVHAGRSDLIHIDVACMLIRKYVLEKVPFGNRYGCNCQTLGEAMKLLPFFKKSKYLDKRILFS